MEPSRHADHRRRLSHHIAHGYESFIEFPNLHGGHALEVSFAGGDVLLVNLLGEVQHVGRVQRFAGLPEVLLLGGEIKATVAETTRNQRRDKGRERKSAPSRDCAHYSVDTASVPGER